MGSRTNLIPIPSQAADLSLSEVTTAAVCSITRAPLHGRDARVLRLAPKEPQPINVPFSSSDYPKGKRVMDLLGASLLLAATSPLMIATAIAVRISSPGPVILRQRRLTQGGQEFPLLKFRSMRVDAEKHTGAVFAQTKDPRITPVGRFIRRTRLDELPQLINVLRGEMSLIGPRPERPEVAEQLRSRLPHFDKRLRAKAGLTGLAQVAQGYANDEDSYREKVAWDVLYIRKRSALLDLWIAAKTVVVVFTGSGAR